MVSGILTMNVSSRASLAVLLLIVGASTFGLAARVSAQTPGTPPPPPPLWDVQVGASFVGTSGNSETTSTGADFAAHRRGLIWQVDSTAVAVRVNDHDTLTAERYLGTLRGQRFLSTIMSLSSGIRLERDKFAGIDFRSIIDGGLGWRIVHEPRWTLDGVTAIAWNHERPVVGIDHDDAGGVLQVLSRVPFGAAGDTTQRLTVYPNFTRSNAYRSEAEVTAQAAMNSHLALKLGYLVRYAHDPVPGFKTTDHTTTASVVFRWQATTPAPTR